MKKLEILYISKSRYLSLHFLNGWKNCFLHLGYKFKHIQCDQVELIDEYLDENFISQLVNSNVLPPEKVLGLCKFSWMSMDFHGFPWIFLVFNGIPPGILRIFPDVLGFVYDCIFHHYKSLFY